MISAFVFNSKGPLVVLRFYVVEQVLLLLLFGGKQEEEHKIIDFSHKNQFMFVFWEEKQQIKFFVKMPVAKTAGVRAGRLFSIFLLISQIFFKVNTRTSLVIALVIFFTQLWANPLLHETLKNGVYLIKIQLTDALLKQLKPTTYNYLVN